MAMWQHVATVEINSGFPTGCAIGSLLAIPMLRVWSTIFNDSIAAQGPLAAITATVIAATIALLACYMSARRAMRVDPMVALRYE